MPKLHIYIIAHEADNIQQEDQHAGWATTFQEYLAHILKVRDVEVKFYNNNDLEELNLHFLESDEHLLILPIVSDQSNNDADWHNQIQQCVEKFSGISEKNKHYSLILKDPVNIKELMLKVPQVQIKYFEFFTNDGSGDHALGDRELMSHENIHFFILHLFELISDIDRAFTPKVEENNNGDQNKHFKSVYLADTSFDLLDVRSAVKRELQRQGYTIYPLKPYPYDEQERVDAIVDDLVKCSLSVHFIGQNQGNNGWSNGLASGELQNKVAAELCQHLTEEAEDHRSALERIIWLPEDFQTQNETQKTWVERLRKEKKLRLGAEFIRCTVEELKDVILEKLSSNEQKATKSTTTTITQSDGKLIYLIYNEDCLLEAQDLMSVLAQHGLDVLLTETRGGYQHITSKHHENLLNCDAFIILTNEFDPRWLRSKMKDVLKVKSMGRNKPYAAQAIMSAHIDSLPAEPVFNDVVLLKVQGEEISTDTIVPFLDNMSDNY